MRQFQSLTVKKSQKTTKENIARASGQNPYPAPSLRLGNLFGVQQRPDPVQQQRPVPVQQQRPVPVQQRHASSAGGAPVPAKGTQNAVCIDATKDQRLPRSGKYAVVPLASAKMGVKHMEQVHIVVVDSTSVLETESMESPPAGFDARCLLLLL